MQKYQCHSCGQWHDGVPRSYGAEAPAQWYLIPESERDTRVTLSSDQCVIDEEHFFVLGNIEIPIQESTEPFIWSVWVSLSEKNFTRASELWTTPGREAEPPYFGWLSTSLPCYPKTLSLKTRVHTRPVGQRFLVQLEASEEHPLAVEQRQGISWSRVQVIAEEIEHGAAAV